MELLWQDIMVMGQAGSRFVWQIIMPLVRKLVNRRVLYHRRLLKNLKIDPINGIVKFELNTSKEYLHPRKPKG